MGESKDTRRESGGGWENLAQPLRAAGYRITRQRRAVLQAMADSPTTLSALQLWQKARIHCPDLGLATVYRTLEALNCVGGAERVHAAEGAAFVSCPPGDHHHVVCVLCGRVAEFHRCNVDALIPGVVQETGFQVEAHLLELTGTCPECQVLGGGRGGRARGSDHGRGRQRKAAPGRTR